MSTHRGLLHHMNINVSDMKRSSPFYDAVFRDLGYDLDDRRESGEDWKRWELDTPHEISIIQADKALGEQRFVRGRVGCFNHIAFFADPDGLRYEFVSNERFLAKKKARKGT